jgi:hypothetical protein
MAGHSVQFVAGTTVVAQLAEGHSEGRLEERLAHFANAGLPGNDIQRRLRYFLLARLCLKFDGGQERPLDVQPPLSVDRSRAYRAHQLVLGPGGARAADRANELAVLN